MSRFSVEAVFRAIDKISNPVKGMTNSTNKFSRQLRKDFAQAQRSVENFHKSVKQKLASGLKMALATGVMALGLGLGLVAREFVSFDHAIVSSTAKFNDLVPGTERARKAMEDLRKVARQVGANTQFTPTEAAKGLDYLAMAGFTSVQAMTMLPGVVNLATIANVDLARSTDIASDALGAFGLMTKDATKLEINFTRLQDVMAKTVTSTNTNMEDLFEAIKFGAPAFTIAGQSMEAFNAVAGRMAANGIKGTNAGTALRAGMIRLSAPPKAAAAALDKMSIKIADSSGKMRNIVDIMKDMEVKLKTMTPIQRTAALAAIFGKNAFSAWASVLNEGVSNTEDLYKSLLKANGASEAMAAEIRKSLLNRLKSLGSAATELGFKFMVAFEKQGGNAIDKLTKAVRDFDPTPIIDGIKTVGQIIVFLWGIIKPLLPFIGSMVVAWYAYKAALFIVAAQQAITNAIMAANPIGLIIIAIGILVGLVITLYMNWDKLSTKMKVFLGIISYIVLGPLGLLLFGFVALAKNAGGVKNAFIVLGKIIMKALLSPVNLLIYAIRALLFTLSKIPVVGDKFKGAYQAVSEFQDKINNPFKITEFDEEKKRKRRESFDAFTSMIPKQLHDKYFQKQRSASFNTFASMIPKQLHDKYFPKQKSEAGNHNQSPTTQRESFFQSYINQINQGRLTIQNNSKNDVDHNGRPIPSGSSVMVPTSG